MRVPASSRDVAALCLSVALVPFLSGCGEQTDSTRTAEDTASSTESAAVAMSPPASPGPGELPTFAPGQFDATSELPPDQAALVGPDESWGWMTAEECATPHPDGSQRCTMAVVEAPDGSCGFAFLPLEQGAPIPRDMSIERGCEGTVVID